MTSVVIDASATLAAYLRNEQSAEARVLFARAESFELCTPSIWRLEVTNGLLMACRRRRIEKQDARNILRKLVLLEVKVDAVPDLVRVLDVLEIAEQHELSIYDSAYLELAIRLDAQLATLDARLARAAAQSHIELAIAKT